MEQHYVIVWDGLGEEGVRYKIQEGRGMSGTTLCDCVGWSGRGRDV